MLFLVIAALTLVAVIFQQQVRSKHQIAALVVLFAAGGLWKISTALKKFPFAAESIFLEVDERELVLGHLYGESRIKYSAILKVKVVQQEWPEIILNLKDGQSIQIQGFENIAEIANMLQERVT